MKVNQIVNPSLHVSSCHIGREDHVAFRGSNRINSISKFYDVWTANLDTKRRGINHFIESRRELSLSRLTDLSRHWKLHRLIRRSTMQTYSLSFSGSLLLFRREIDKLCIQLFMLGGHNRGWQDPATLYNYSCLSPFLSLVQGEFRLLAREPFLLTYLLSIIRAR